MTTRRRLIPAEPIVIPTVDGPGVKFAADLKTADDCLTAGLAAAGSYDERVAARRTHRAAYDSATAVFYADWRVAWDAACEAAWGPVRSLDAPGRG